MRNGQKKGIMHQILSIKKYSEKVFKTENPCYMEVSEKRNSCFRISVNDVVIVYDQTASALNDADI